MKWIAGRAATFGGFMRKEFAQTLHDKRMRLILFYIPLLQLVVYGVALSTYTQNIRLAVAAKPSDAFTRHLAQRLYAGGWFVPIEPGAGDPGDWVRSGKAEAVLVAPPDGADRDLGRGQAQYQLLVDSLNAVRARSIETYASAVVNQAVRDEGFQHGRPRLDFVLRTFYNPEGRTPIFLIPGTLCLLLFIATTVLTNMSMSRERERGTIETLFSAPVAPWEIVAGKTLPFVALGLLNLPFGLLGARLLGVPVHGPLWLIMLSTFVFLCAAVSVGLLISLNAKNQQQAVLGGFLYTYPATQLSGVIFPIENMPRSIAWVAYLNPLHYYVDIMRHLMLKGGDLNAVIPRLAAITVIGCISMVPVMRRFRQTLN